MIKFSLIIILMCTITAVPIGTHGIELTSNAATVPNSLLLVPTELKDRSNIRLKPHPRIFVNANSLAEIRNKLKAPEYVKDVNKIRRSKHPTDQAFVYLIWEDEKAAEVAKQALLGDSEMKRYGGLHNFIQIVQLAVMYDWLYAILSADEKIAAQKRIRDAIAPIKKRREKSGVKYYHNDHWARGFAFESIAILALAGDVRWASNQLLKTYTNPSKFFSPYNGGAIDTLNTVALDSGGGNQAGHHSKPGTGYEGMFLNGANLFIRAWETATGESLWSKTSYFEKLSSYLLYSYLHVMQMGESALQALEYGTGLNSEKSAGLNNWLLEKYGRAKYALVFRLLLGDLRRGARTSPEELKLPLASYLKGADLLVSRTGWKQDDIGVFLFARHWDTSRYEPSSGLLSIYKNGEPILVRGIIGKGGHKATNTSGVWFWNKQKDLFTKASQGSTFWRDLVNIPKKPDRAHSPTQVLHEKGKLYRPETLKEFAVTEDGKVHATTRYESLIYSKGVSRAERAITHDKANITVQDDIVADPSVGVLVSYRLVEEPQIIGNIVKSSSFEMTIRSKPDSKIYYIGGLGKELIGPSGKWHGNGKSGFKEGYAAKKQKVRQYGLGYLFIEPVHTADSYHFTTEIEIK